MRPVFLLGLFRCFGPSGDGQNPVSNRPNPFTDRTWVHFQLPEAATATLEVHDPTGRLVFSRTDAYAAEPQNVQAGSDGIIRCARSALLYVADAQRFWRDPALAAVKIFRKSLPDCIFAASEGPVAQRIEQQPSKL